MRGATECARRLKKLHRSLKSKGGKVSMPPYDDPISQLILGVFSRDNPESKAREVLDRLRQFVVDYNELRVTSPREMAEYLGSGVTGLYTKCEDISRALNRIFAQEHIVSLSHLEGRPVKEMRAYLDGVEGLEAYSRARIRLQGLRQHAVPLDEAMWAYAIREQIVDANCELEEAQQFLERQIPKDAALEFVALLRKQAWQEMGDNVRDGQVRRIESVPPDRTSSNMLQPIVRDDGTVEDLGALESEVGEALTEKTPEPEPQAEPAVAEKPARGRRKVARKTAGKRTAAARKTVRRAKKTTKKRRKAKTKKKTASKARKSSTRTATKRKTKRSAAKST
jgi:hypothetical protein